MRAYGWRSKTINESEMALFHERMPQCAQKELDTAEIVREAIYQQLQAITLRFCLLSIQFTSEALVILQEHHPSVRLLAGAEHRNAMRFLRLI